MAFDEPLATRTRDAPVLKCSVQEKKMFGGGSLPHGNILVGVWKDSLIVLLGPTTTTTHSRSPPCNGQRR
jgi:hypothetical protein